MTMHTYIHTYMHTYIQAKKRKKPQNSCRRRAGNGGDTGGKRKICRKERVGPVAANPDNLESNKKAGGGAQGTQGSNKNCTSRESVSPLSRLIRGFRNVRFVQVERVSPLSRLIRDFRNKYH